MGSHGKATRAPKITRAGDYWRGHFDAMACDCEVLIDTADEHAVRRVVDAVAGEARRIERKFSRYRDDNIIHRINHSASQPVEVDAETAQLLDFAGRCFELSDGRFDITSGALRRAWTFDGGDHVPTRSEVAALLSYIGWEKIRWEPPAIVVPVGMEVDLGGIGKEYAVDRAARLACELSDAGIIVNFGGDLTVTGPRPNDIAWVVGIENPGHSAIPRAPHHPAAAIEIRRGAIATSGDAKRYLEKNGVRYSHVLDPRTGWPVVDAPRSVTVLAGTCSEAGFLATLALLNGENAEAFLEAQGARHWCVR